MNRKCARDVTGRVVLLSVFAGNSCGYSYFFNGTVLGDFTASMFATGCLVGVVQTWVMASFYCVLFF